MLAPGDAAAPSIETKRGVETDQKCHEGDSRDKGLPRRRPMWITQGARQQDRSRHPRELHCELKKRGAPDTLAHQPMQDGLRPCTVAAVRILQSEAMRSSGRPRQA